jgi:hypothetical protein
MLVFWEISRLIAERSPSFGFRVALFCTRTYARILRPGFGLMLSGTSSFPSALRRSFDKLEQEINSC